MQQENEQGFPFGWHGENSWKALCGATRTSRIIPGLMSAQWVRHQLAPCAQEMVMPCGGLSAPTKHVRMPTSITTSHTAPLWFHPCHWWGSPVLHLGRFTGGSRRGGRPSLLTSTGRMELIVCKDIEFPSSPPCLVLGQGPKPCKHFGCDDGSVPGNAPSSPSFWAGGIGLGGFRSNNR